MLVSRSNNTSQIDQHPRSRHILSFDLVRGGMIFYVIILHALIQRVFSSNGKQFEQVVNRIPMLFVILLLPLILLAIWGSVFTLISGASTTYSIMQKYQQSPRNLAKITKKRLFSSFMVYLFYNIEKLFFSVRITIHPQITFSMITGSLEQGTIQWPTLLHLTTSSTLESIAITGALISLLLYGLLRKRRRSKKQIFLILLGLAIGNLILTFLLRSLFPDPALIIQDLPNQRKFVWYSLYLRLFADRFAHFPVFAFGLIGACFGILVTGPQKQIKKSVFRFGLITGFICLTLFLIPVMQGFNVIAQYHAETVPLPLQFLTLGLQTLLITGLLHRFDLKDKHRNKRQKKILTTLQNYSNLSLTIYILEPFMSQLWYLLFAYLNKGPFFMNLPLIMIYLQTCVLTWFGLVKIWNRIKGKGSFEWILHKSVKKYAQTLNRDRKFFAWLRKLFKLSHHQASYQKHQLNNGKSPSKKSLSSKSTISTQSNFVSLQL